MESRINNGWITNFLESNDVQGESSAVRKEIRKLTN
jgi:hypothetical protein